MKTTQKLRGRFWRLGALVVGVAMGIPFAGQAIAADGWQPLLPDYEIDSESIEVSAATVRGLVREHLIFADKTPPLTLFFRLRADCAGGTLFSDSQSGANADGTPTPVDSTPIAFLMTSGRNKDMLAALCERRAAKKPGIHSIAELRAHYGADGAGKSDDQLILDYAPRVEMAPFDLALMLGYDLRATSASASPGRSESRRIESFADRLTEKVVGGAVLGGAVGLLVALFVALRYGLPRWRAAASKSTRAAVGLVATGLANASLAAVHVDQPAHDAFYVQALDELDGGNRDKATWARAVAASDGDDGRARANYIKLRVALLGASPP